MKTPLTHEYAKNNLKQGDKLVCGDYFSKNYPDYAETGDIVTFDRVSGASVYVKNDKGKTYGFYPERFYLPEATVPAIDLQEQIKLAKSYVGKTVLFNNNKYVVNSWDVVFPGQESSTSVELEVAENGFCVVVKYGKFASPVLSVHIVNDIEVKLNDEYTAIVSKDSVKVGCQTFSHDKIAEIQKAIDKLK